VCFEWSVWTKEKFLIADFHLLHCVIIFSSKTTWFQHRHFLNKNFEEKLLGRSSKIMSLNSFLLIAQFWYFFSPLISTIKKKEKVLKRIFLVWNLSRLTCAWGGSWILIGTNWPEMKTALYYSHYWLKCNGILFFIRCWLLIKLQEPIPINVNGGFEVLKVKGKRIKRFSSFSNHHLIFI
jgi:hypothetical protein